MIALPFEPDYAVHPSVTLLEMLREREWAICDLTDDEVEQMALEIYIASARWDLESRVCIILDDLTELLGRRLGPNARFWQQLEANYLNHLEQQGIVNEWLD